MTFKWDSINEKTGSGLGSVMRQRSNTYNASRDGGADATQLQHRQATKHFAQKHVRPAGLPKFKPKHPTGQKRFSPPNSTRQRVERFKPKSPTGWKRFNPFTRQRSQEIENLQVTDGMKIMWPLWAHDKQELSLLSSKTCFSREPHSHGHWQILRSKSQRGEDQKAMTSYFHGCSGGTFLEMGALDGLQYSNTYSLEHEFGWKGVLIEASPQHFRKLVKTRPGSIVINAAVCDTKRTVHYIQSGGPGVKGIREFMAPEFLKRWHGGPHLVETPILCMPLSEILEAIPLRRFDFFSLDLEGAELAAISSVDFGKTSFSVLAVEADGLNHTKDFMVSKKLRQHGYKHDSTEKGNEWYSIDNQDHNASSGPGSIVQQLLGMWHGKREKATRNQTTAMAVQSSQGIAIDARPHANAFIKSPPNKLPSNKGKSKFLVTPEVAPMTSFSAVPPRCSTCLPLGTVTSGARPIPQIIS